MNRKVVYPGTFDPITNGHIDIIKRASQLFDTVYVAVAESTGKNTMFSIQDRVKLVKDSIRGMRNVIVEPFDGLVVNYVKSRNSRVVIRGIRMISDFEYEFQMALTNRKIAPSVEIIFMMPSENYSYLSSRLIKEVAELGADISSFVPRSVEKALKKRQYGRSA